MEREPKLQARVLPWVPITHNDKFQAHNNNNNNVARIEKSSCFGVKSESYSILVGYSYKGVGAKPAIARNWAEEKEIPRRLRLSTTKVQVSRMSMTAYVMMMMITDGL